MAVDVAYLKNLAPEFSSETDPRINWAIGVALTNVNTSYVGAEKVDYIVGLTAAAILKMGNLNGAIGIAGEKVGDVQNTYVAPREIKNALENTSYGLQLVAYLKTIVTSPFIAGGCAPFPFIGGEMPINWPVG